MVRKWWSLAWRKHAIFFSAELSPRDNRGFSFRFSLQRIQQNKLHHKIPISCWKILESPKEINNSGGASIDKLARLLLKIDCGISPKHKHSKFDILFRLHKQSLQFQRENVTKLQWKTHNFLRFHHATTYDPQQWHVSESTQPSRHTLGTEIKQIGIITQLTHQQVLICGYRRWTGKESH